MTNSSVQKVYEFEDFRLDAAHKLLYRNGEQVALTPKAVETLIALVERRGEVVGKRELIDEIWVDTVVEESNLSQYLHVLRKTLRQTQDGQPFIETLKRRGYRFNGDVRVLENSNGLASPQFAPAGNVDKLMNCYSSESQLRSRRVERRGNVFAIADWQDFAPALEVVSPDDRSTEDRAAPAVSSEYGFHLYLTAAVVVIGVILFAAFTSNWFNSAGSSVEREPAKSDLTILPLTNAEIVAQATISPDGKYFAYTEFDGDSSRLWLQTVGESARVEVVGPRLGLLSNLSFTPDSTAIYFVEWTKESDLNFLYRVGALGGAPTRISSVVNSPVSFSPDGTEIVFTRYDTSGKVGQLVIAASDGTRERILLKSSDPELIKQNPAWSPDGKRIAFGIFRQENSILYCSLMAIEVATGISRSLSPDRWDSCSRSAWTRDGSALAFIGTKFMESLTTRRDQVYLLDVGNGESRRITTDGNLHEPFSLGITSNDVLLAVPYNRVSHIWTLKVGSDVQTARQITTGQTDGRGGIAALPDGKIAFLSRTGDAIGIFRANVDGSEGRKQILTDPTMEELRAAPDGSFLVFAAKIGGYGHIFRIDSDGTDRRQLTFGENNQSDSTVSPDGKWIVYASTAFDGKRYVFTLRKIPAGGGESVQFFSGACESPHFANDGRTLSCNQDGKIRVISFPAGDVLKTFGPKSGAHLNTGARFSPDDKNLVYRVSVNSVGSLWQQPIAGGDPKPLADFKNGELYNFSFASDGSELYLARGNQIRNAVLIKNLK